MEKNTCCDDTCQCDCSNIPSHKMCQLTHPAHKFDIEKVKNQGSLEVKTILKTRDGSSLFVTETIQYLPEKHLFKCIITEDFSYK